MIHTIEPYNPQNRRLLHKIKIGRSQWELHKSLPCWVEKAVSQINLLPPLTAIMPAPSSLYSRAMGRYDVAYFFSRKIASALSVPVLTSHSSLHWNLRKRSREANRKWDGKLSARLPIALPANSSQLFKDAKRPASHLLVVDDVVKSGWTLEKIYREEERDWTSVSFLALFDARLSSKKS